MKSDVHRVVAQRSMRKVARLWLRRCAAKSFSEWVSGRRFKNPRTDNEVLFKSLPKDEQDRIRSQWRRSRPQGETRSEAVRDPLFHTTSYSAIEKIREKGIVPRSGGGVFEHGGYGEHSQGKVFLSDSPEAARSWQNKVFDQLEYRYGDDEDLGRRIPVMLRIKARKTEVDPVGDRDVPGSRMTQEAIPPEDIEFWHPEKKQWFPVADWGEGPDTDHAVSDRDEYGVYLNDEAFMPPEDDDYFVPARESEPSPKTKYPQEPRPQEPRPQEYLDPIKRRSMIERIKERGAKAPFPMGKDWDTPGVFPQLWQERLKVDRNGNPLPGYPL